MLQTQGHIAFSRFPPATENLPAASLLRWLWGKESACQCRRHKRYRRGGQYSNKGQEDGSMVSSQGDQGKDKAELDCAGVCGRLWAEPNSHINNHNGLGIL